MQQVVPSIPEQKIWITNMNRLNTEQLLSPLTSWYSSQLQGSINPESAGCSRLISSKNEYLGWIGKYKGTSVGMHVINSFIHSLIHKHVLRMSVKMMEEGPPKNLSSLKVT